MNVAITLATAGRILAQLRHDRRTLALLVGVPSVLMILLRYVIDDPSAFNRLGPTLLGIFPFVVMFLVTSITTQRERATGTLERLMAGPLGKFDLLVGYALAFGAVAAAQVTVVLAISLTWLGLDLAGSVWTLILVAVLDSLLGMALGLFFSAFARTEFQAVQFMPAVVLPQALLCGLIVPRDAMAPWLEWLSDVMPLSYAVEAMQETARTGDFTGVLVRDVLIVGGCTILSLVLGAATLRRRTP
ncbi:ABC transporter permease [Microtetraspora sp. NBRC 16547]|uniref:ABC transporter permease n=1 Tax=Microtetraspora sp. NBRC 16547 TaxID=3030993 RepID=UPI0024A2D920|nr:ABC transporter permease [Microtetraspora sp. NBRC 16547]GLW98363.1 transport permease protein [Microtetraspora sp. NBRC 16547]